jgi:hypothetical protein
MPPDLHAIDARCAHSAALIEMSLEYCSQLKEYSAQLRQTIAETRATLYLCDADRRSRAWAYGAWGSAVRRASSACWHALRAELRSLGELLGVRCARAGKARHCTDRHCIDTHLPLPPATA